MFSISVALPISVRIFQYVLGYVLFDAGCTVTGAYSLLPMSMTGNYNERNFILSWSILGQGFGALPVALLGTMFIAGSMGYTGSAVIFSAIGILLALIPALFVKERNVTAYDEQKMKRYNMKEMLKVLASMPEAIFLAIGNLLWGLFYVQSYLMFEAFYIFKNPMLAVIGTLFGVIPTLVVTPFLPAVFKRLDKIIVARFACIVFVICGTIVCLLGPGFFINNIYLLFTIGAFQSLSYTMTMFATAQLIPDLAEIAKYRMGMDVAGIVGALFSFIGKTVNSLVASISLLILGAYGWQSVEASSFDELAKLNAQGIGLQTETAIHRICFGGGRLFLCEN
jgi:Na+/melibiose symporter-like transporter